MCRHNAFRRRATVKGFKDEEVQPWISSEVACA